MEIKYQFTKEGINAFLEDALADIFAELEKDGGGHPEDYDFYITCGDRSIRVPCLSDTYENLSIFLANTLEDTE